MPAQSFATVVADAAREADVAGAVFAARVGVQLDGVFAAVGDGVGEVLLEV